MSVGISSMLEFNVNNGNGYGGGFYWQGGGAPINPNEGSALLGGFSSPYFGFQLICGSNTCRSPKLDGDITVQDVALGVHEVSPPRLASPIGLLQAAGWVRGIWPLRAWGNSPSGLCTITATLNGTLVDRTTSPQDLSTWHQCAAPPVSQFVDTARYGEGAIPLVLTAVDAAEVPAGVTKTVYVDNQQPSVTLSGPADAPSTAGTQYVTAVASAGPSGVADISCAVDGAPAQTYPGGSAQVPVSGIGQHLVQCFAENNAVDGGGRHGISSLASDSLKIGAPTVTGIAFSRIADQLRCRRVRERVRVAPRWVTVRRHHRRVKLRRPAATKVIGAVRCQAQTVRRRRTVWVTERRHGRSVRVRRRELVRVVVLPHVVNADRRRVGHGRPTTVSGWLGTSSGVALAGQPVQVLAAPDDGTWHFSPVASATTAPDGGWTARLPAGPSRLIEAAYAGGAGVEPSLSGLVREVVPARISLLRVRPRRVPWGGTVRLTGRLEGGHLPAGGALVRLRIGLGSTFTTYGVHEHVGGDGRFTTSYTFGAGEPGVRRSFWFQVASLPMGDYPYAPASSRRQVVIVGGRPTSASRHAR